MAEDDRPKYGSPELECKLVCDTLKITSEKANERACYIIANAVNRPAFRRVLMEKQHYLTLIDYLTPPKKALIEYQNRHGLCIRKMDYTLQANVNKAACVALTVLSSKLKDSGRLTLVSSDLIQALLVCYAMTEDVRNDVKHAALDALKMYSISVGHRDPAYPDASSIADTFFDRSLPKGEGTT